MIGQATINTVTGLRSDNTNTGQIQALLCGVMSATCLDNPMDYAG